MTPNYTTLCNQLEMIRRQMSDTKDPTIRARLEVWYKMAHGMLISAESPKPSQGKEALRK